MLIDLRDELPKGQYDNYEVQTIYKKLTQDNYYRQDFERLIRQGKSVARAIDELEGRY